jgi:DNA-binding response OmpR family regulator
MTHSILIVDDDVPLSKTIESILQTAGYQTLAAYTAEDGVSLARSQKPDLALLDVMIPAMGGWEMCRQIRAFTDMPIIFLTAMSSVENVVQGLETGADDYIVKPFDPAEMLARIMAHLRRAKPSANPDEHYNFGLGDLEIDVHSRSVRAYGKEITLTNREFQLLQTLAARAGKVITSSDLARSAWGMDDASAIDNIKPYIHYLRKKIEADPASPRWIQTVRGVGYRLLTE